MDGMNREKFRQMTLKQKAEWLFRYYGITVLVIIIVALAVISLISAVFFKDNEPDLRVLILDDHASYENAEVMQKELDELLGIETEVNAYLKANPLTMQAFLVRLTANRVDMIICPEEEMLQMQENEYILKYEEIPAEGNYARATVYEEGTTRMSSPVYIAVTENPLKSEGAVTEKAYNYFLN